MLRGTDMEIQPQRWCPVTARIICTVQPIRTIVTVTLNTAIDRVVEARGFAVGAHQVASFISRRPAGKAVNVSRGLARLNVNHIATGFVGRDELSQFEHFLHSTGPGRITPQFLAVAGRTRENLTIIDPEAHTDTHLREAGFEVAAIDVLRISRKLRLLAQPGVMILISGSLPPGMQASDLVDMVASCRLRGAMVGLDLGGDVLQQVMGLEPRGRAADERGAATDFWSRPVPEQSQRAAIVKPNRQELARLLGLESVDDDAVAMDAAAELAHHADVVIVTHGEAGAWLLTEGMTWRGRLDLPREKVHSTVGCGDAMLAGVLHAWSTGRDPGDMLRQGLAAAAANATRRSVADYTREQVRELTDKAQVEKA